MIYLNNGNVFVKFLKYIMSVKFFIWLIGMEDYDNLKECLLVCWFFLRSFYFKVINLKR